MSQYTPIESSEYPDYFLIPGYSRYVINAYGDVLKVSGFQIFRVHNRKYSKTSARVKAVLRSDGYLTMSLKKDGAKSFRVLMVDELVCLTFNGPAPENKPAVNHKDGNPLNNHCSNLEWCDYVDLGNHSIINPRNRNIPLQVLDVTNWSITEYHSIAEFARFIGKSASIVPKHWMYSDRKGLYLDRFCIKKADDPTPWPTQEILFKYRICLKNLKTNDEYDVYGFSAAATIMDVSISSVRLTLQEGKQHFPKYWLAKFYLDNTRWMTMEEYMVLAGKLPRDVIYIRASDNAHLIAPSLDVLAGMVACEEEALRRALEHLGEMPDGSKIMYLDNFRPASRRLNV